VPLIQTGLETCQLKFAGDHRQQRVQDRPIGVDHGPPDAEQRHQAPDIFPLRSALRSPARPARPLSNARPRTAVRGPLSHIARSACHRDHREIKRTVHKKTRAGRHSGPPLRSAFQPTCCRAPGCSKRSRYPSTSLGTASPILRDGYPAWCETHPPRGAQGIPLVVSLSTHAAPHPPSRWVPVAPTLEVGLIQQPVSQL